MGAARDDWRLIAELRVSYADGSERVFGTDETSQVRRSSVVFKHLRRRARGCHAARAASRAGNAAGGR